jgi:hypothetical protein
VKRSIPDVLRRGFDNAVANWQLLLIRLGEAMLFTIIIVAALILMLVPIILSIGIQIADLQDPESMSAALEMLASRWTILFYILGVVFVLMAVFLIVHSFVEAGSARVYVDGDRAAGPEVRGAASRYRVFSMARWWAGAADGWWPVFWMYNIAWGAAGIFIVIPPVATLALALAFRENEGLLVGISCLGLLITFAFLIPVAVVVTIWMNRAIAVWAVRRGGARDTLNAAWAAFKADFGRHILVALVMFVISIAGSMFIGSFTFFAGMAETMGRGSGSMTLMLLPVRFAGQFLSMAFSAVIAGWFLAAFCAMASEE